MKKRKIGSLLLCALLTVVTVLGLAVPASAEFDSEIRNSVAVVATSLDTEDGAQYLFGYGTGFFVGETGKNPEYLVTAYHVIENFVSQGAGELYEYTITSPSWKKVNGRMKIRVYYDSGTYEEAYYVDGSSANDIAVLRLASPTSRRKPVTLREPTDALTGARVYAVGYPSISENSFAGATSSWSESDSSVTSGIVGRVFVESGVGRQMIQTDCQITPGNSGGPLVDDDTGAVLGINVYTVSNQSNSVYYAASVSNLIPMLRKNNIAYFLQEGSGSAAAETEAKTNAAAETEAPVSPAPEPEGGLNLTLILLVGVLVVAAVVVAVVLKGKKQPKTNQGGGSPIPGDTGLRFQGVEGVFRGQRFAVTSQLRIGRDPARNDFVYPAGTGGISGVHCQLTYRDGQLYIQDLGSTYGTFVNGRKLAPQETAPLRPGDRFSLGSEKESFTIVRKGG